MVQWIISFHQNLKEKEVVGFLQENFLCSELYFYFFLTVQPLVIRWK